MGHYNTANVIWKAGAEFFPPSGLFSNIKDPNELRILVKNSEGPLNSKNDDLRLPFAPLWREAAAQFIELGEKRDAEEMYRQALEHSEKSLGAEDPATLTRMRNEARVLQDQGKFKAAEEMYERVLDQTEELLGVEHSSTLTTVKGLASLYHVQKRYGPATIYYHRAIDGFSKTRGLDHLETKKCSQEYDAMVQEMECQDLTEFAYLSRYFT